VDPPLPGNGPPLCRSIAHGPSTDLSRSLGCQHQCRAPLHRHRRAPSSQGCALNSSWSVPLARTNPAFACVGVCAEVIRQSPIRDVSDGRGRSLECRHEDGNGTDFDLLAKTADHCWAYERRSVDPQRGLGWLIAQRFDSAVIVRGGVLVSLDNAALPHWLRER
jgi:hypothetical protein